MRIEELLDHLTIITLWIGLWGIVENLIEYYSTNRNHKLLAFGMLFVISLIIICYRDTTSHLEF